MNKRTLYKEDSQGTLRFWSIWTDENELIQEYGVVGGKPIRNSKECEAKNVGKKNERTPEEQAESEAQSKIDKKLDKAYFETKEEAENNIVLLPMKAKEFDDQSDKIDWDNDVYIQKKLDGMRCLAQVNEDGVNLISRQGKEIENMAHVERDLLNLFDFSDVDEIIFDGELYKHNASFQENMRLIKKYREGKTEEIKYWIYDRIEDIKWSERQNKNTRLIGSYRNKKGELNNIRCVKEFSVQDEDEIREYHNVFIDQGFEGTMVRHGERDYKTNKRDQQLLKYKDFQDIACTVKDVVSGEAAKDQGVVVCEYDNKTFKASLKFSHEERENILENKNNYIGETAEIRFFEKSEDGIPRFPVCVGFRLDK